MVKLILLSISLTAILCAAQQAPSANLNAQSNKASASESPGSTAQTPASPEKQQSTATQTTGKSPSASNSAQRTISGCLNKTAHGYTLTDSETGTVYTLTGNTGQLSSHVGHEMQITGHASNPGNEAATGAPSGKSRGSYQFQVGSAKHIADQCGPGGATANGPSL